MVNEGFLLEPGAIHSRAKMSWQQINLRNESNNAFHNWSLLNEMRTNGKAICLSEFPVNRGPAIILGSGSSLDMVVDDLKNCPLPIFCSTSQLSTLVYHGRQPEFICVLDPTASSMDEFSVPAGQLANSILLAHPSAPYEYFARWFRRTGNKCYMFRILEPTYDWYTHHLRWAYPWIKAQVLPFIDSGASEISLATKMGYNPLYLLGIDYGGPRFDWWRWIDEKWELDPAEKKQGMPDAVPEGLGMKPGQYIGTGGLETSEVMEYSMRGVMITSFMGMKNNALRIYHLTGVTNTAPFFPTLPYAELKANNWQDNPALWTDEFREGFTRNMEIYLCHKDTWMVPAHMGFSTPDWRVYMMQLPRARDALIELSREIMINRENFENLEKQFKMSIHEMIAKDLLTLEKGELLIRDESERKTWDWRNMKAIDVEGLIEHFKAIMAAPVPSVDSTKKGSPKAPKTEEEKN